MCSAYLTEGYSFFFLSPAREISFLRNSPTVFGKNIIEKYTHKYSCTLCFLKHEVTKLYVIKFKFNDAYLSSYSNIVIILW